CPSKCSDGSVLYEPTNARCCTLWRDDGRIDNRLYLLESFRIRWRRVCGWRDHSSHFQRREYRISTYAERRITRRRRDTNRLCSDGDRWNYSGQLLRDTGLRCVAEGLAYIFWTALEQQRV